MKNKREQERARYEEHSKKIVDLVCKEFDLHKETLLQDLRKIRRLRDKGFSIQEISKMAIEGAIHL